MKLSWFLPCVALVAVGCGGSGQLAAPALNVAVVQHPLGTDAEGTWDDNHATIQASIYGVWRYHMLYFESPLVGDIGTVNIAPRWNYMLSQIEVSPGDGGAHKNVYQFVSAKADYQKGSNGLLHLRVRDVVVNQVAPTVQTVSLPDFDLTCSASVGRHSRYVDAAALRVSASYSKGGVPTTMAENILIGPDSGVTLRGERSSYSFAEGTFTLDLRKRDEPNTPYLNIEFMGLFERGALPSGNLTFGADYWLGKHSVGLYWPGGGFYETPRAVSGSITLTPDGRVLFRGLHLQFSNSSISADGSVKIGNANRIYFDPFSAPTP